MSEQYKTGLDSARAMGQCAISSKVGKLERLWASFKRIKTINSGGIVCPDGMSIVTPPNETYEDTEIPTVISTTAGVFVKSE